MSAGRGALVALLLLASGCGKYGPPVRASQTNAEKAPPGVQVPLPGTPAASPAATPAPESTPAPEQEPPPEGEP